MNCDSCEPPKNSLIAATTGRMLTSWLGAVSCRVRDRHPLADHALHAQQADAELVLDQLTHCTDAAVAQVVDVVRAAAAVIEANDLANDGEQVVRDSALASSA